MKHKLNTAEQEELRKVTRIVSGSIRDAILQHGPITNANAVSATKRIANQLYASLLRKKK